MPYWAFLSSPWGFAAICLLPWLHQHPVQLASGPLLTPFPFAVVLLSIPRPVTSSPSSETSFSILCGVTPIPSSLCLPVSLVLSRDPYHSVHPWKQRLTHRSVLESPTESITAFLPESLVSSGVPATPWRLSKCAGKSLTEGYGSRIPRNTSSEVMCMSSGTRARSLLPACGPAPHLPSVPTLPLSSHRWRPQAYSPPSSSFSPFLVTRFSEFFSC